jgi:hypothetical protein
MASSTRLRTTSAWLAAALVAALVPLLGLAAPAQAAECTTEVNQTSGPPLEIPTGPGCDDVTPPETSIESVTPEPNSQGWLRQDQVTFAFTGAHTDDDQDPIAFECQFFNTETAPDAWEECTSPATYSDLEETTDTVGPYTFRVRAVDTADDGIDRTTDPLFPQDTDEPDFDQSPSERTVKVDTIAPAAFIFEGPYDKDGTGWPITKQPRASFLLRASEDNVTYRCLLDGQQVACDEGRLVLSGLSGGSRTLSVSVTDRAGNKDESAETAQFVVPYNLTQGKNWSRKKAKGYFARDVMQTRRTGARIKFRAKNIREFRLIAPADPAFGKIRVRTGTGFWKTYDLAKGKKTKSRYIVVRDAQSPLFSGRILIESLSRGKVVRVDALVFPPS